MLEPEQANAWSDTVRRKGHSTCGWQVHKCDIHRKIVRGLNLAAPNSGDGRGAQVTSIVEKSIAEKQAFT